MDTETSNSETAQAPSPRAFCQATGVVYQSVGLLLALSVCCGWGFGASAIQDGLPSSSEVREEPTRRPAETPPDRQWASGAVWTSFAAGLGCLAAGIGLQHERRRAGQLAMLVSGLAGTYFAAFLVFGILHPAIGRLLVAAVMVLIWLVLFLLAGHSAELLKRYPPPRDPPWTERDEDGLRRGVSPDRPGRTSR